MAEKENKAIELLKFYEGFFKNIGHEEEVKSIESIINYIEKLQKEAEETQPIIEVLENFGKNGHGEYSKRYFAEYRAIHHTAFYDFIPDPDEIYKKYYEQKKEIEKLQKENEELKYENLNLKEEKMIDNSSCKPLNNFYDYYDCIPKDKIREKLEKIEKEKIQYYDAGQPLIYMLLKNQLKSLIEEKQ